MSVSAAVFSSTSSVVGAFGSNVGFSFTSVTLIVTVIVASVVVSGLPCTFFPSCTDTVTS